MPFKAPAVPFRPAAVASGATEGSATAASQSAAVPLKAAVVPLMPAAVASGATEGSATAASQLAAVPFKAPAVPVRPAAVAFGATEQSAEAALQSAAVPTKARQMPFRPAALASDEGPATRTAQSHRQAAGRNHAPSAEPSAVLFQPGQPLSEPGSLPPAPDAIPVLTTAAAVEQSQDSIANSSTVSTTAAASTGSQKAPTSVALRQPRQQSAVLGAGQMQPSPSLLESTSVSAVLNAAAVSSERRRPERRSSAADLKSGSQQPASAAVTGAARTSVSNTAVSVNSGKSQQKAPAAGHGAVTDAASNSAAAKAAASSTAQAVAAAGGADAVEALLESLSPYLKGPKGKPQVQRAAAERQAVSALPLQADLNGKAERQSIAAEGEAASSSEVLTTAELPFATVVSKAGTATDKLSGQKEASERQPTDTAQKSAQAEQLLTDKASKAKTPLAASGHMARQSATAMPSDTAQVPKALQAAEAASPSDDSTVVTNLALHAQRAWRHQHSFPRARKPIASALRAMQVWDHVALLPELAH